MTTVLALKRQKVSLISLADTPPNFDSYTEIEAEQALIGAVMNKPSIFPALAERVTPADFSILVSGYIWWAFDQLMQANKGIDLFTVSDLLGHTRPEYALDAEIQNRLIEYMGHAPNAKNAHTYADRVLEAATRMRLLKASQDIRELALNKTLRVADIVDGSDKALYEATNKTVSTDTDATSITARYYNRVEDALVNGVKSGISYGFDALDNRMGGLMPGGVSVLAAPAGAGKTSLVLSLIRQLATCQKRVALYSLEMTDEQIIRSLIAMEGKLDRVNLMQFKLSRQDWSEFVRASGLVSGYPLHIIDDYTSLSPEQLRLSLRKLTSGGSALDAIVIDGLWLMHPSISTGERRTDVKLIIEKLVSVSRDFNTPILLVHQLSRAPGDRNDKRPMLSDLSESISVSQTAEIVLGLYRPTYYDRNHVDSNTYLTVLKARHIPNADSLTFVLEFDASRGAYTAARDV